MWSAPKQPFVLPVRIRSFEELYSKNVNKKENAEPFEKSVALEIKTKSEERNKAIAHALQIKLKENEKKLYLKTLPDDIWGIYDGQLYIFLKEIKQIDEFKDEFRNENELKPVILKAMLDCDITIQKAEHPKKGIANYYCAPKTNWEEILK
ncbi:MAG: hypothetical protein DDT41_01052 [candidate division WS2 bacterium]|nr:hypothetical protein [Candidatus Psychracetigena formicireducens]